MHLSSQTFSLESPSKSSTNACSAEGFLPGPILPHKLWVKPYSGIIPRSNEITKSTAGTIHVFTSEILNSSDCGVHKLSFNLYKM